MRVSAQPQAARLAVYQLGIRALGQPGASAASHRATWHALARALEGERDPRNLLRHFEWVALLSRGPAAGAPDAALAALQDDVFQMAFCYFPITFHPPPNDPFRVTPEALRHALLHALRSTLAFATPALMHGLQEKLATSSASVCVGGARVRARAAAHAP